MTYTHLFLFDTITYRLIIKQYFLFEQNFYLYRKIIDFVSPPTQLSDARQLIADCSGLAVMCCVGSQ